MFRYILTNYLLTFHYYHIIIVKNRLKDLGETVKDIIYETAPKVIRNNSQAKGPNPDDTLESLWAPTKQLYVAGIKGNVEESFR